MSSRISTAGPRWNPDVKSMDVHGGLAQGSVFRWKAGPGTITSTIQEVEPARRIAWTGTTFGVKAKHVYRLEARGEGTLVHTEESYEGLVTRLPPRISAEDPREESLRRAPPSEDRTERRGAG